MKKPMSFHEQFDREEKIKTSSDRNFCLVFACVFMLLAAGQWHHQHMAAAFTLAITALAILLLGLTRPALAAPLNRIWTEGGLVVGKITNPIMLLLLYLIAIVPAGLIMKLLGKDPLNRIRDKEADSYWISRTPPGPTPESMRQLF